MYYLIIRSYIVYACVLTVQCNMCIAYVNGIRFDVSICMLPIICVCFMVCICMFYCDVSCIVYGKRMCVVYNESYIIGNVLCVVSV